MAIRKAVEKATDGVLEVTGEVGGLLGRLPLVWEYISSGQYEDGSRRVPATLSVFVSDGRLTAGLNDRDQARIAFRSGETLEEALGALEQGLAGDSLDWRRSAAPKQGRKK